MTSLLIQATKLSKSVATAAGSLDILTDIDCEISKGETVAIVGPSGAGKTTLLSILAGLEIATSGSCYFNGQDLCQLNEDQRAALRRGNVGFVFQSFHLLPMLTALENVALPLELLGDKNALTTATELLTMVGLADRASHLPLQLSGGEQQRVAIARSCVTKPQIIFADEPTGNLDDDTSELVLQLLFTINQEHATTLVLVTHSSTIAKRCDTIHRLHRGRIWCD